MLQSDGVLDLARHAWDLSRYVKQVDSRATFDPDAFDTRIYVTVKPPHSEERSFVEGQSEQGGRLGIVEVELAPDMADLTLFVVTHELMHTLGATDKYDSAGRTVIPGGLAEPDRSPLHPQPHAEEMARNRVVAPGEERIPVSLDELGVGPATAREIGWIKTSSE